MTPEIKSLIFIAVLIIVDAIGDTFRIRRGYWIDHTVKVWQMSIVGLSILWLIHENLWEVMRWSVLTMGFRWILFDILLNKLRGLNWWYMPPFNDKMSKLDRMAKEFFDVGSPERVGKLFLVVKLFAFVCCLAFYHAIGMLLM